MKLILFLKKLKNKFDISFKEFGCDNQGDLIIKNSHFGLIKVSVKILGRW